MRNKKRIKKILNTIEKIWTQHPDLRLGQLLLNCNVNMLDIYDLEDNELEKKLREIYLGE